MGRRRHGRPPFVSISLALATEHPGSRRVAAADVVSGAVSNPHEADLRRSLASASPSVATGSAPGNAAGSVSGNTYSMSGDAMTSSSGATGSNANSTRQ
jgi:hypothetical protein